MSGHSAFDPRRILGRPSIYRLFEGMTGRDRAGRRLEQVLAIGSGARVLDIGCGTADILHYLPGDIDYYGFDVSGDYISAARARYGTRGSFRVHAVTPAAADELGSFDVVMALGVLHHLTDAEADDLFCVANKVLRPNGRVVTVDGTFVRGQNPLARLLLKLDRGQYVRTPEDYLVVARRSFPNVRARIIHDLLRIPYTHCILEGVQSAP